MTLQPIPNPLQEAVAEQNLATLLREIPETVTLPEAEPADCRWPVLSAEDATAVIAHKAFREDRIARIKAMAESMIAAEQVEIRRLQYAVGGYVRRHGEKLIENWGTLEEWAQQARGEGKHVKLPFGRLQFRAVAAAVRVPDEKVEAFVAWCNRSGNTHLYRLVMEPRMKELKEYMEQAVKGKREIPTDEQGVTVVEHLEAGRYETFSVVLKEEA